MARARSAPLRSDASDHPLHDNPVAPQDRSPIAPVALEIAHLSDLDLPSLRHRWRKLTRQDPPAALSRYVLQGLLAYRIQARVYGDLDPETVRYLDRVARDSDAGHPRPVRPVGDERVGQLKPGTILIREHEGAVHRVMVMADGFAWSGTPYDSLSAVARAITGTNWNGPRFFGLRDRAGEARVSKGAERHPAAKAVSQVDPPGTMIPPAKRSSSATRLIEGRRSTPKDPG